MNKCIPNIHTHLMGLNPFFQKQTLLLFTCPLQEDFVKWKCHLFLYFISTLVDLNPEVTSTRMVCRAHWSWRGTQTYFSSTSLCAFSTSTTLRSTKVSIGSPRWRERSGILPERGYRQGKVDENLKVFPGTLFHWWAGVQHHFQNLQLHPGILRWRWPPVDTEEIKLLSDMFGCSIWRRSGCRHWGLNQKRTSLWRRRTWPKPKCSCRRCRRSLSQAQRRIFLEDIIPIIISLKYALEKNKIPAPWEHMHYLREAMLDYWDEIKDFLTVDKQLITKLG